MNSLLLFLTICIPSRILITFLGYYLDPQYLPYLGIIYALIGISMLTLYFVKYRMDAFEANGETWWHNFRLIHGMLYLTASIYAFYGDNRAWIPLAMDTVFGLILFIDHHAYPVNN